MDILLEKAKEFRERCNIENHGGIVVFHENKAFCWRDEVRDPESFLPGCIAIDKDGNAWETTGGDDYNGAKEWVQILIK